VRTALKQAGILMLAAGLAALVAVWAIPWKDTAQEGDITLAAALKLQPPPLWIDARPAAEYHNEHIPGALSLNEEGYDQLVPKVLEQWEPDRTAVVYCDSPAARDSREVAERLRDFKLGPVFVLQGGWQAWKQK